MKCLADQQPLDSISGSKVKELASKYKWYDSTQVTADDRLKITNTMNGIGGSVDWPMIDNIVKAFDADNKKWLED